MRHPLVWLTAALVAVIAVVFVGARVDRTPGESVALVAPSPSPTSPSTTAAPTTSTPAVAATTAPATSAPAPAEVATVGSVAACRIGDPGEPCGDAPTPDLPGCPDEPRGAVVDKAAQRFWLCENGLPITEAKPMTSASESYGLPPVTAGGEPLRVFAKNAIASGIHGERLERFVAFYTTPRGNRIAFHQYVNQDESTVGDLDQRGDSSGCLRVRTDDSHLVWDFLQIGDPVVILTP